MTPRIDLPPYPRGWFAVSASKELSPGDVQRHQYFGQELVLFRTDGGKAVLFDAYCPHLGAHLGHGGRVDGNDLVCPFHGWRFGTDGACNSMPYGKRIPSTARARRWHLREKHGVILAWHCPKQSEPDWEMPDFDDANWTPSVSQRWEIDGHPQEISENQADFGHFIFVHGTHYPKALSEPVVDGPLLRVEIESDPDAIAEEHRVEGPVLVGSNCGHGPGLTFATIVPKGTELAAVQRLYATPIDEERVALLGVVNVGKLDDESATRHYLDGLSQAVFAQWEADIEIWKHKVYRPTPALNDAEQGVAVFRRWYQQFYVDG
jgi:phenylpropionate dioxygenase-like ring-hydroxylating dioxygenase large terminal subunit